jgi:hypothetical protein
MVDIFLSTIKRLVGYVAVGVAMMVPLLPLYIGKGETIAKEIYQPTFAIFTNRSLEQ